MEKKQFRKASPVITQILANNILAFRKSKNLSQEELADLCDLHRTYIGSVERGERNVTLSTLEALAGALGVNVPELLTERIVKHDTRKRPTSNLR
jgi:transcriptional regulator with XRE-family HTH domain